MLNAYHCYLSNSRSIIIASIFYLTLLLLSMVLTLFYLFTSIFFTNRVLVFLYLFFSLKHLHIMMIYFYFWISVQISLSSIIFFLYALVLTNNTITLEPTNSNFVKDCLTVCITLQNFLFVWLILEFCIETRPVAPLLDWLVWGGFSR